MAQKEVKPWMAMMLRPSPKAGYPAGDIHSGFEMLKQYIDSSNELRKWNGAYLIAHGANTIANDYLSREDTSDHPAVRKAALDLAAAATVLSKVIEGRDTTKTERAAFQDTLAAREALVSAFTAAGIRFPEREAADVHRMMSLSKTGAMQALGPQLQGVVASYLTGQPEYVPTKDQYTAARARVVEGSYPYRTGGRRKTRRGRKVRRTRKSRR